MEIRRDVFEKVVLKERWLLAIHLHGNKKGSFFEKVVSKEMAISQQFIYMEIRREVFEKVVLKER